MLKELVPRKFVCKKLEGGNHQKFCPSKFQLYSSLMASIGLLTKLVLLCFLDELEAAEEKCCTDASTQSTQPEPIEVGTQTVQKRAETLSPDAEEETDYVSRESIMGASIQPTPIR